ncbi:cupin domain-containing protein [Heyndrickxia sp. NPDC080065]|uniref:cupin domain-containing protein n=1 Tax=Heyndrickxia sp. NPDC080065 TaxID=3390568 RepID=UPI003D0318ED
MKKTQIKNIDEIPGQQINWGGEINLTVKPVSDEGLLSKCKVSFVELEPGNQAYAYHYHEINEEVFVVLSGEGVVRTINGEKKIKAGDAISFPAGEGGSHVVKNTSNEKLVYVDFSTISEVEISRHPDTGKMMVLSSQTSIIMDDPNKQ